MARTATGARPSVHLAAGTNFSTEGTAAGTMLITNVMEPLGGSFVGTGACSIAEDTTLADTAKTYNTAAITSWSGSVTAYWDELDTNGQLALTTGSNVVLKLAPEGYATGDTYYTGNALVTEITRTVARGAVTEISFSFVGNGALSTLTV